MLGYGILGLLEVTTLLFVFPCLDVDYLYISLTQEASQPEYFKPSSPNLENISNHCAIGC